MDTTTDWSPLQFTITLPEVVGREDVLTLIMTAIPPQELKVFYLWGHGGIGKTRLEQEVLERARKNAEDAIIFSEPIDLYHYPTHSIEGLMRAVRAVLPPQARSRYFADYDDDLSRAFHAQQQGNTERAAYWQQKARTDFGQGFRALCKAHPVVMAFDTLEVLGRIDPEHKVLGWLCELLRSAVGRVTVLVAGRPCATVEAFLRQQLGDSLVSVEVGALSEKAVSDYLDVLARQLEQQGQTRLSSRLKNLNSEDRKRIHLLTAGRPILIALLNDLFLSAGDLPEVFCVPLDTLKALPPEQLEEQQKKARDAILERLWQLREPWRSTLLALAITRKGMTPALLSALQEIDAQEAEERLERLTHLTLIKRRPFESELRVYLHDELYAMLDESYPNPDTRATYLAKITDWYETRRQTLVDQIRKADPDSRKASLQAWLQQVQQVQIEQVHYLLRKDWREGLGRFVEYSIDAFTDWNLLLDFYLQSEVRDHLETFVQDEQARAAITWELTLAQVRSLMLRKEEKTKAYTLLDELATTQAPDAIQKAHHLLWTGVARLEQAQYQEATRAFTQVEALLPPSTDNRWVLRIKSSLYKNWGYALRLQYKNRHAAEAYCKAIPAIRKLDNRYELADLLKNLAFCLAESGEARKALTLVQDALDRARREGATYLEGLTLNTLALVLIRLGLPEEAATYAQQAFEVFTQLENPRGQGLAALALANAYRRLALKMSTPIKQREQIKNAQQQGEKALQIFREQHEEKIRLVEALIETGCALRDRILIEHNGFGVELKWLRNDPDLAGQARKLFQEAISFSDIPPYYRLDAGVNLGLLELYLDNLEDAGKALCEAEMAVASHYLLKPGGPYPPQAGEEGLWLGLGKLYLARADLSRRQGENWSKVAEYATLALAYDELFSPESFGAARGQEALYRVLKKLSYPDLQQIYHAAWQTAHRYQMPRSWSNAQQRTLMIRFLEMHFGPTSEYLKEDELRTLAED